MKIRYIFIIIPILFLSLYMVASAEHFTDVDDAMYAKDAIIEMAKEGLIVGNSSGLYKPLEKVTKVYATKVLSKLAGYKDSLISEPTKEETEYYIELVNKYADLLLECRGKYTSWDKNIERNLLYLLDKNIIPKEYLDELIIEIGGNETYAEINKEELAYLIYNIIISNKGEKAKIDLDRSAEYLNDFTDKSEVSDKYREALIGLYKAEVYAKSDKIEPKSVIYKAQLAVVLKRTIDYINKDLGDEEKLSFDDTFYNVIGKVSRVMDEYRLELLEEGRSLEIYTCSHDIKIYRNKTLVDFNSLKEGEYVKGRGEGGKIVELYVDDEYDILGHAEKNVYVYYVSGNIESIDDEGILIKAEQGNVELKLLKNLIITKDGRASSAKNLKKGDYIKALVCNTSPIMINAKTSNKSQEEDDDKDMSNNIYLLSRISIDERGTSIIIEKDGTLFEYMLSKDCEVKKDGIKEEIYSLDISKEVYVEIVNNVVVKIVQD